MSYNERKVVYFTHCGEADTDRVLMAARARCEELGLKSVVIASAEVSVLTAPSVRCESSIHVTVLHMYHFVLRSSISAAEGTNGRG